MTVRQESPTLEEFLTWPEEKPYCEFIHGRVRQKTMPDFPHSCIQSRLVSRLDLWSESNQGWTLTEQRCMLEVDNAVEVVLPDVAWWSSAQLATPPAGPVRVAPTLAVEVLSPNDRYGDVQDKVFLYLTAGVRIIWIVDPASRNVTIYRPAKAPELATAADVLEDEALPGLAVTLAELFARLPRPEDARPRIQE